MTIANAIVGAADDSANEMPITDFTAQTADLGWYIVNDNVMGGKSDGAFDQIDGALFFSGETNTDGGGFSSIRTRTLQLDLSEHDGIRLRVKGDGRRYTWRLATNARRRGSPISYWAEFPTVDNAWTTVDLPFSRFVPKFRGFELDGPPLDPARVTGMGLMIYDGQDGPFDIELQSVHAFSELALFSLANYRWQHRVLVLSAANSDDEQLRAQRNAVTATADDFSARDMLLVTLLDDGRSAAGDRELTPAEVAASREALGIEAGAFGLRLIGKDGTVKLSENSTTPMSQVYGLIDTMPMRRAERLQQ